jgi:transposase
MNTYNEEALGEAVQLLHTKPHTIPELAERFKKSERTIKRWLQEMRDRGHRVVREGVAVESPYCIVQQ